MPRDEWVDAEPLGGGEIPDAKTCVIALKQLPADTPPNIALALQGITFYEGENEFKETPGQAGAVPVRV